MEPKLMPALIGEFALRDVGLFVDQVHDFKVGVGVLGFTFTIHDLRYMVIHLSHATALPVSAQYRKKLTLWSLFNFERFYHKPKSCIGQQGKPGV